MEKDETKMRTLEKSGASELYLKHFDFTDELMQRINNALLGAPESSPIGRFLVKLLGKMMMKGSMINQYSVSRALGARQIDGIFAMLMIQEVRRGISRTAGFSRDFSMSK